MKWVTRHSCGPYTIEWSSEHSQYQVTRDGVSLGLHPTYHAATLVCEQDGVKVSHDSTPTPTSP